MFLYKFLLTQVPTSFFIKMEFCDLLQKFMYESIICKLKIFSLQLFSDPNIPTEKK